MVVRQGISVIRFFVSKGAALLAKKDRRQENIERLLLEILSEYKFEVQPVVMLSTRLISDDSHLENEEVIIDQFVLQEGIKVDLEFLIETLCDFRTDLYDDIDNRFKLRHFKGNNGAFFVYELFQLEDGKIVSLEILASVAGLGPKKKHQLITRLQSSLVAIFNLWFDDL